MCNYKDTHIFIHAMALFNKRNLFKTPPINTSNKGYSLLELMLSTAIGSIVIAGSYASFVIISNQYDRISAFSEVHDSGVPVINLLSRDIRMAGRTSLDTDMKPIYSAINTPISITDSGDSCCDSLSIIYDRDTSNNPQRCQITYQTIQRPDPDRNALYMTVNTLNSDPGDLCIGDGTDSLVADYVEDLQFVGSENNINGHPQVVDVSLVTRSQSKMTKNILYEKSDQALGDYEYSFNDRFYRDEFTSTISIKNIRD